jgi:telomere length regulation protein
MGMASTQTSFRLSPAGDDGDAGLDALALDKVAEVADAIAAVASAKEVVGVIHTIAAFLFPIDSVIVTGEALRPNPQTCPKSHIRTNGSL